MSRTRTVFALALVGAILVAVTAQAQQERRRGEGRGGMGPMTIGMVLRIEKVQEELKLTDEQKEKLRDLRSQWRESPEEARKKLAEILSADQLKRAKELRLQAAGIGALTDPEVAKELKLSDDQVSKLKELQQKSRESMREAFQGTQDLSQEERRAKMTELRPKMEQAQKEHTAKAMEILTAEQREKLEKMKGAKSDIDFRQMPRRRVPANP